MDRLNTIYRQINNPNLIIIEWDISKHELIDEKVDETISKIGKIDILINNSGIYSQIVFLILMRNCLIV